MPHSKKRYRRPGRAPVTSPTNIRVLDYDAKRLKEKVIKDVKECIPFRKSLEPTWVQIEGLGDRDRLNELGNIMGLHHLIIEDILNTDQRTKIENFGSHVFVVLKLINYSDETGVVSTEQISLILGRNFVVSYEARATGVFEKVRERIKSGKGRIRKLGADYLCYALIDAIIDSYYDVIERMEERIETIENELIDRPNHRTLAEINSTKREMIFLRKALWPLREVILQLERGESKLIKQETRIYMRDINDHVIQAIDAIESFREILSGMLDAYLSSVSNRMNEVMKTLTIIATIFMPLTFIAGVYGMNFRYMPELSWVYGYPIIMVIMAGIGAYMVWKFKKKNWF